MPSRNDSKLIQMCLFLGFSLLNVFNKREGNPLSLFIGLYSIIPRYGEIVIYMYHDIKHGTLCPVQELGLINMINKTLKGIKMKKGLKNETDHR